MLSTPPPATGRVEQSFGLAVYGICMYIHISKTQREVMKSETPCQQVLDSEQWSIWGPPPTKRNEQHTTTIHPPTGACWRPLLEGGWVAHSLCFCPGGFHRGRSRLGIIEHHMSKIGWYEHAISCENCSHRVVGDWKPASNLHRQGRSIL